jgi:hypothetical protein
MTEREEYEKWHSDQGWQLDAKWHEDQQRYTIFTSTQSKWTAWQACAKIKDKQITSLNEENNKLVSLLSWAIAND